MKQNSYSAGIAGICFLLFLLIVVLLAASCDHKEELCDISGTWECVQCVTQTKAMVLTENRLERSYTIGPTTVRKFGYTYFTNKDTLYALPDGGGIYRKYVFSLIGCDALQMDEISGQIGPKEIFKRVQ